MGKGLRFSYKVGDQLKPEDVEKIYMLKDEKHTKDYIQLLEDAPKEYVEVIQSAIQMAEEKMEGKLGEQIFVSLLDHLIFAIKRQERGIVLQNRMLWEIQKFYPEEYLVAEEILREINGKLQAELPDAEIGNIAFHLVNAQIHGKEEGGAENGVLMVRMLKDIFQIVQIYYKKQIDEKSMNYSRFVIHVQFFLQRLLEDKMLKDRTVSLFDAVSLESPEAAGCVEQIRKYIKNLLGKEITREEQVYLIVHIARVTENS